MEDEFVEMEADNFNQHIYDKKVLYNLLEEEYGFFLPPFKSQAVTVKYLLEVANKEVYCPLKKNIKEPEKKYYKGITKADLFYQLKKGFVEGFGYGASNLPPKHYLATFLFSIEPNDILFRQRKMITKIKIDKE